MATPSVPIAIEEVRALALELGVDAQPLIVADRSNLVLRLEASSGSTETNRAGAPASGAPPSTGLIARVAMATSQVRVGMAWLSREVDVARFLEARRAPVTLPSRRVPPGPFERNGLVISFWEQETIVSERADPRAAGAALAVTHRALVDYPTDKLPTRGGFDEAREVYERVRTNGTFDPSDLRRLEVAWDVAARVVDDAASRTASFQAVHGDAHIGNVLATARGAVWTDWEDAFIGPVEWDIACLRSKADLFGEERDDILAMIDAYDAPYDADLARELGLARNLQVIVWLAVFAERQPNLLHRMRARLDRLP